MKSFFNKERIIVSLILTFVFSMIIYAAMPISSDKGIIYENVIRLHVLANSDSNDDQNLKLAVRDEITKLTEVLYKDCIDIKHAAQITSENLDILTQSAQRVVDNAGYSYPVWIETGYEYYPVRHYSEFTFPSGEYFSLRVQIGQAQGQNWWCVLFPPLCVSGAVSEVEVDIEKLENAGFTEEAIQILLEGNDNEYTVKWKFVEWFEKIFHS